MRAAYLALLPLLLLSMVPVSAEGQAPSPRFSSLAGGSPFLGGVPTGSLTAEPIPVSIADAIDRALEHNLGLLLADHDRTRSQGERWTALSALLPQVGGRLAETRQLVNLRAFGFPLPEGVPAIVGPFNVFDARVYLSQTVIDFKALNEQRAKTHDLMAADHSYKGARDLVVLVTANLYLQALAAASRADAAVGQLQTAQALYTQADDLRQAGLVAGVDVVRAQVELSTEQQRATATKYEAEKAKLQLARVIGLPIGQSFTLNDNLPDVPVPQMSLDEALARAYAERPDYLAALERVRAAEAARNAAADERLPSLHVNADYGDLGLSPRDSHYTYSLGGSVNVPLFQGGRIRGKVTEADADLRDRRAEADDLRAGVYYDVRAAFFDLESSGQQLQVARAGRDLATQQLTQARDRFAAGVTSNIEVVQAQEALGLANEQYIAALYGYNVAKATLARGLGSAEATLRQFLGGSR